MVSIIYTILKFREYSQIKFKYYNMSMKKGYIFSSAFVLLFINFLRIYALENEYFEKGLNHYQKNEFGMAAAHFEEAKKIAPQDSLIYFYLGNALRVGLTYETPEYP